MEEKQKQKIERMEIALYVISTCLIMMTTLLLFVCDSHKQLESELSEVKTELYNSCEANTDINNLIKIVDDSKAYTNFNKRNLGKYQKLTHKYQIRGNKQ